MQDDESFQLYENVPVVEKTSVSTYTFNFEYVLSETVIRFRPFIAFGLAMLSSDVEVLELPDDNVTLPEELSSGNTPALVLPVGFILEYPVMTNILIGLDFRYQHITNPKASDPPRGWYQSFLQRSVGTFSASMNAGFRF